MFFVCLFVFALFFVSRIHKGQFSNVWKSAKIFTLKQCILLGYCSFAYEKLGLPFAPFLEPLQEKTFLNKPSQKFLYVYQSCSFGNKWYFWHLCKGDFNSHLTTFLMDLFYTLNGLRFCQRGKFVKVFE